MLRNRYKQYYLTCRKSLEACRIAQNDELTFSTEKTDNYYLNSKFCETPYIYYQPSEDMRYVKLNYMLTTRTWCPVNELLVAKNFGPIYNDKGTVTETRINELKYFEVTRRLKLYDC